MFKKLTSIIVLISMLFSMTVFAEGSSSADTIVAPSGVVPLTEEEYQEYLNSLTDEDLEKIAEKERCSQELANQPMTRSSYAILLSSLTMNKQETDIYCTPACIQSMLRYIKGQTIPQKTIAGGVYIGDKGTEPSYAVTYLNKNQSFYYTLTIYPGVDQMLNNLYSTIANSRYPCMVNIATDASDNWYYTTGGHSLVAYGIQSDKTKVYLADPLAGIIDGVPRYYDKQAYPLQRCCLNIIW